MEVLSRLKETSQDYTSDDVERWIRNCVGIGANLESPEQDKILEKPIFWSRLEKGKLPSHLAQYGRDFSQIADFLKTKTPHDVKERLHLLVHAGEALGVLVGRRRLSHAMTSDAGPLVPSFKPHPPIHHTSSRLRRDLRGRISMLTG